MVEIVDRIRDNRRDIDRGIGEALRYYGGPLGERVLSLAQLADMLNPVAAIRDAGSAMREGDYVGAATDTAAALVPVAGARAAMSAARGIPSLMSRQSDEAASGVVEAMTGSTARQASNTDMTRRQFLGGMAAAGGAAAVGQDLLGRVAPDVIRQINPLREIAGNVAAKEAARIDAGAAVRQLENQLYKLRTEQALTQGDPALIRLEEEISAARDQLRNISLDLNNERNRFVDFAKTDPEGFSSAYDDLLENAEDIPWQESVQLVRLNDYISNSIEDDVIKDVDDHFERMLRDVDPEDVVDPIGDLSFPDEYYRQDRVAEQMVQYLNTPAEEIPEQYRNRVEALKRLNMLELRERLGLTDEIPF